MVDAGRAKEKVLDSHGAAARFQVTWISKASAEQRAGRAGRTGPGHCYRLPSHCTGVETPTAHPMTVQSRQFIQTGRECRILLLSKSVLI